MVCNVACRSDAAHLTRVQCRAARAVHAMGAVHLTYRVQVADVALPPAVSCQSAVVVLGTDGDLQRLGGKVDVVAAVQLDGGGCHCRKALDGQFLHGTGLPQIFQCFFAELCVIHFAIGQGTARVAPIIQKDAPLFLHRFNVDQDVDQRRAITAGLARVKGPLIALEENRVELGLRIRKSIFQKLPLIAAVLIGGDVAGQHLLVAAGEVPAELDGCDAILRLGKVFAPCTRTQRQTRASGLRRGVHRGLVHSGFAAGGVDHICGTEHRIGRFLLFVFQRQHTNCLFLFPVRCREDLQSLIAF